MFPLTLKAIRRSVIGLVVAAVSVAMLAIAGPASAAGRGGARTATVRYVALNSDRNLASAPITTLMSPRPPPLHHPRSDSPHPPPHPTPAEPRATLRPAFRFSFGSDTGSQRPTRVGTSATPGGASNLKPGRPALARDGGCRTNHSETRCINWSTGSHMSVALIKARDWESESKSSAWSGISPTIT